MRAVLGAGGAACKKLQTRYKPDVASPRRDIAILRILAILRGDRKGAAAVLGLSDVTIRSACHRYRKDGLVNARDELTAAGLAAVHYDDVRGP
jgi:hypothetical protein